MAKYFLEICQFIGAAATYMYTYKAVRSQKKKSEGLDCNLQGYTTFL